MFFILIYKLFYIYNKVYKYKNCVNSIMTYKRKKRQDAKKRSIPAHTRNGTRVSGYRRKMRKDIRNYRTVKKRN